MSLKKTALAIMILSSNLAFAGAMGPSCQPGNVSVPCEWEGWDIGLQALYLQPSLHALNYIGDTSLDLFGTNIQNNFYQQNYNWAFLLEGSYHFGTGTDINLNWSHYDHSTDGNFLLTDVILLGVPDIVTATRSVQWDALNLEYGQHVDFGEHKKIRFHGGLQLVNIDVDSNFVSTNIAGVSTLNPSYKYSGVGPRIGTNMAYFFNENSGFALTADGAIGLLIGDSKFDSNATFPFFPFSSTTTGKNSSVVVPELEADVGMKYDWDLSAGILGLKLGWKWINYFDALQVRNTSANFSMQGPYAGIKWVGII